MSKDSLLIIKQIKEKFLGDLTESVKTQKIFEMIKKGKYIGLINSSLLQTNIVNSAPNSINQYILAEFSNFISTI